MLTAVIWNKTGNMGLSVNMEKENTRKRDIQTHERDVVRVYVCVRVNYLGSSFISAWVTIEYMNGRNGRSLQGVQKYIGKYYTLL